LAGMHLIGQRLPPKQAYMRYHEPEIWGVSRKDVYFMRNWLIASQLAGVGALTGFALLSKASGTQRKGHVGMERQ
ncbi:MAG: hypothetical protein KJ072_11765, partial [Verrucomicrobia bacterium]|nr:hypothetical protein [Verrucomicrobiota bacterium]